MSSRPRTYFDISIGGQRVRRGALDFNVVVVGWGDFITSP